MTTIIGIAIMFLGVVIAVLGIICPASAPAPWLILAANTLMIGWLYWQVNNLLRRP